METLWQDVKFSARMLAKRPGFAAVAVITLALGIGANTAIFSVVRGVLLRPLPYADPERLVWLWERQPSLDRAPFSGADFLDYESQTKSFDHVVAVRPLNFTLTGQGDPERVRGGVATPNIFAALGKRPVLGRDFAADDAKPGAPRVALLTFGYWQRRFGGDAGVVGRSIALNEASVTIVGVLPQGFTFMRDVELWLNPRHRIPEVFSGLPDDPTLNRRAHYLSVFGKLKPGVTLAQANADLDAVAKRLQQQYASNAGHTASLVSLYDLVTSDVRPTLLLLSAAVGLVLLIACANVANLLLARATERQREVAIRTALGASRGRLVRQLLTENALLALAGGALGLALAWWGVDALVAARPQDLPRLSDIRVDTMVLAFTLSVSFLTGLLFGLAPALRASRVGLSEVLKEGGRGAAGGQRHFLRNLLVVSEVAMSLVLLVGAGLLVKSMVRLLEVKPGFNPKNLATMWISFSSARYSAPERTAQFLEELLPRLEALPGVSGVAFSNDLPLEGQDTTSIPTIEGVSPFKKGEEPLVGIHVVNPRYFEAMGIPLLRGRAFAERDRLNSTPVAVINESMAKRFWPTEDPIGKRFRVLGSGPRDLLEIVGVVGDVRHNGLNNPASMDSYLPVLQRPWDYIGLAVRAKGDAAALAASVGAVVRSIDPSQPVFGVRNFDQVLDETLAGRRLALTLLGLFATLAAVLAAVGLYGVMAFSVTQRTHEIGIRMALGAQPGDVLRMVIRQGLTMALAGVAIGIGAALGLTRFLTSMLFEVNPTDPVTFVAVALGLAAVALVACYVPARRATRVEPVIALRYE